MFPVSILVFNNNVLNVISYFFISSSCLVTSIFLWGCITHVSYTSFLHIFASFPNLCRNQKIAVMNNEPCSDLLKIYTWQLEVKIAFREMFWKYLSGFASPGSLTSTLQGQKAVTSKLWFADNSSLESMCFDPSVVEQNCLMVMFILLHTSKIYFVVL